MRNNISYLIDRNIYQIVPMDMTAGLELERFWGSEDNRAN